MSLYKRELSLKIVRTLHKLSVFTPCGAEALQQALSKVPPEAKLIDIEDEATGVVLVFEEEKHVE